MPWRKRKRPLMRRIRHALLNRPRWTFIGAVVVAVLIGFVATYWANRPPAMPVE